MGTKGSHIKENSIWDNGTRAIYMISMKIVCKHVRFL